MYFAHMFCYGNANDIAGITGIRGCMGVIYVGAASLYSIHIPPGGRAECMGAGQTFATWVKNQENRVGKGHGHLVAFSNGRERNVSGADYTSAEEEIREIKKALKSPPTTLYRIKKHLGANSGELGADSVAIMLERVHASESSPGGYICWYKRNDQITWVNGGAREAGQYLPRPNYSGTLIPSDLNAHWWRAGAENCTLTVI